MELIESIRESLIEQNRKQRRILSSSTNKKYITEALHWVITIEGYLFWQILHNSYYHHQRYDYDTIIKLFILYGPGVFELCIPYICDNYYIKYYDSGTNTLTSEGFEYLCKQIEENGIVRKHSEEFN